MPLKKGLVAILSCLRDRKILPKTLACLYTSTVQFDLVIEENTVDSWEGHHTDAQLLDICNRRQKVLAGAVDYYPWVFFLDSDIYLKSDSLSKVLEVPENIVVIPYKPRWYNTPCVGVKIKGKHKLLGNLPLNTTDFQYFPIASAGLGATLIRKKAFNIPFEVKQVRMIKGEDIGFFCNAEKMGIQAYCLANHTVEHGCKMDQDLLNL